MSAKDTIKIERILFPTDFSESSNHAAVWALSLARRHKAAVIVLHVLDTSLDASGFYVPHLSFERLDEEMLLSAGKMLSAFAAKHFKGYRNVELITAAGKPYQEILKAIKDRSIGLCVMGSLGKKAGVERFFIGSTTERVTREAACPVLVVPPGG
ncbi:MAG: universal stress protein [Deltaproteobacteria bacterium]